MLGQSLTPIWPTKPTMSKTEALSTVKCDQKKKATYKQTNKSIVFSPTFHRNMNTKIQNSRRNRSTFADFKMEGVHDKEWNSFLITAKTWKPQFSILKKLNSDPTMGLKTIFLPELPDENLAWWPF